MDGERDVSQVLGGERDAVLDSDVILEVGKYSVRVMSLTWPKLAKLWEKLRRFRSLFSDLTRGDFDNFVKYVSDRDTFWLEILKGGEMVGIGVLERMNLVVDAEAHLLFMDGELSDKIPVSKATIAWLFANFPFQRLTVQVPVMYYATINRLVRELGFKQEGKKRAAVLINGKWIDVAIFGLLRSEVR